MSKGANFSGFKAAADMATLKWRREGKAFLGKKYSSKGEDSYGMEWSGVEWK